MPSRCWTRREFLQASTSAGLLLAGGSTVLGSPWVSHLVTESVTDDVARGALADVLKHAPTARYWVSTLSAKDSDDCLACHAASELPEEPRHAHESRAVRCLLCAQGCLIGDGERGRCRARMNVGGELKSLVYGRPVSVHVDPVEKKPFYHFLPGRRAFSLSTTGCPLSCKFCQNWEISQARPEDYRPQYISPERLLQAVKERQAPIVAFTYNEPTVFTEYLTDIARLGSGQGRRSVLVSCGFMREDPLTEMCEVLDGIKIDLKGFSEDFYTRVCGAALKPVLRSIRQVRASGTRLELVNLVVPTLNDSAKMLTELAKWVVGELGPDVPVHFTRFHPDYKLRNLPPTPVATLERAREIAMAQGMHYPYVGNVPGHPGNQTYCPGCGEVVIERKGFFVGAVRIKDGSCEQCQHPIAGVWK